MMFFGHKSFGFCWYFEHILLLGVKINGCPGYEASP